MKKFDLGASWGGTRSGILISDQEVIVTETADATPILEANQRLRNAGDGPRKTQPKGFHHVARVDLVTHYNWRKEWKEKHSDKWEWKTWLAMKLRDRDYSKFRTSDMKA